MDSKLNLNLLGADEAIKELPSVCPDEVTLSETEARYIAELLRLNNPGLLKIAQLGIDQVLNDLKHNNDIHQSSEGVYLSKEQLIGVIANAGYRGFMSASYRIGKALKTEAEFNLIVAPENNVTN